MAADQKILREYLVALGFQVNQSGERKVVGLLNRLDGKAKVVAKGLFGVAAAATYMTHTFARNMEKLYYSSRYAETTAGNLLALEYGARNIGLEAGKGAAALKNMTAAIRSNPGLIGLLNSLGVAVRGRDKSDVLLDLVGALRKMPFYVAERYASLFGIDPETLFNMQEGLEKLKETAALRKQMAADMGVDVDKASQVAVKYGQLWREVTERAGLFKDALALELLPVVEDLATVTNQVMIDWVKVVREIKAAGASDFFQRVREGLTGKAEGGGVVLSPDAKKRIGAPMYDIGADQVDPALGHVPRWKRILKRIAPKQFGGRVATDVDAVDTMADNSDFQRRQGAGEFDPGGVDQPGFDPKEYLASLERRHSLPAGLLARVWRKESNEGDPRYMRSPAGAMGHFGFMPKTAKEYGLEDPDDFKQSAEAAARKWADLMKRYGGDTRKAAAAYNWGDGNLARHGLGRAPAETRDYMDSVAGPAGNVTVAPQINIYGVSNPREAGDRVVEQQGRVAQDVVRNMSPKVR